MTPHPLDPFGTIRSVCMHHAEAAWRAHEKWIQSRYADTKSHDLSIQLMVEANKLMPIVRLIEKDLRARH